MSEMCKKCGQRPVEEGEKLCPACKSKRSHFWKSAGEVGLVLVGFVVLIATGGKVKLGN